MYDISLVCITHNLNITKGPEGVRKIMMFLTNTTPTKQARNICLVKRGVGKLSYMVVGYVWLCYTWQFLTTCNAILCNAVIDMGRCCFKFFGCEVLSVVHILL